MLEQLYAIWFQLFGSRWLKVSALIQGGSPPFLDPLLHFGAFPDNRHAISARHLGSFLAKQCGRPRAGWRMEAKEVQRQLAYRLIDETVPPTGRALVRNMPAQKPADHIIACQKMEAERRELPRRQDLSYFAHAPQPLEFDHSETPRRAAEKAFDAAVYALLAAFQAGDVHAIQSASDRLKSLEEASTTLFSALRAKDNATKGLSG